MLNEKLGLGMAGSGAMPVINEHGISGIRLGRQNTHYIMLYMFYLEWCACVFLCMCVSGVFKITFAESLE